MQILRNQEDEGPRHRIGAVSRLAGVPVTTLRVWETRYGAFSPQKSAGQHRLYTDADVIKAGLIRQLAAAGQRVGGIAHLPTGQLQHLLGVARAAGQAPEPAPTPQAITVAVVGEDIATRINAPAWTHRWLGAALDVRHVFADLQDVRLAQQRDASEQPGDGHAVLADDVHAWHAANTRAVQLLLVRVNALHVAAHEQLSDVVAQLRPERVIVIYNYGAQPIVAALRTAGMLVRRAPVADAELAELIRAVVLVDASERMGVLHKGPLIPPRRYSDATLARVAASPNSLLCECPRHIADLIAQLASFEAYSQDCLNHSDQDARVHAYLRSVAGSARAMFEDALETVAQHGGVRLDDEASP